MITQQYEYGLWTKMLTKWAPEFSSSHEHREYAATLGAISSERNPETSLVTPIHRATEKILTSQQVEKA